MKIQQSELGYSKRRVHKPTAKSPRARFQRSFVQWFELNRHRLSLPMRIARITSQTVRIEIDAFGSALNVVAYRNTHSKTLHGIRVEAAWNGRVMDWIYDYDLNLEKSPQGYRCSFCTDESSPFYSTREALWRDHLFEAFLDWVNDKLAASDTLELHLDNGISHASLSNKASDLNQE